jgi:Histidine kinase-, DNA gyrase B-, and HSP90-like ATPase
VYISVNDTGCGISAQALPRIFERLFQDPAAQTSNRSGLGLGLYIANQIIIAHGGRMWAASEPGAGSTFSFQLPVYSLARLLFPVITEASRLRRAFALVRVDLKPRTAPALGNWGELCQQALSVLQRCVYLDKDVVLPPTGRVGAAETFFVVAGVAWGQVDIMLRRIREQLQALPQLAGAGTIEVAAQPLDVSPQPLDLPLEQQVRAVANRTQELILASLSSRPNS